MRRYTSVQPAMRPWQLKLWELLESKLFTLPSGPELFNQYGDTDPAFDLQGAVAIRRKNLKAYIMGFHRRPRFLIVGEAAGPWGARFSGVPFTSERQLESGRLPFSGRKSSLHDIPYSEHSGTVVWGTLLPLYPDFFLWNAIPLHPHRKGQPLSIRTPRAGELRAFSPLLGEILKIFFSGAGLGRGQIIALGRKAEYTLDLIGVPCRYVRHPAQSGAVRFRAEIGRILPSRRAL